MSEIYEYETSSFYILPEEDSECNGPETSTSKNHNRSRRSSSKNRRTASHVATSSQHNFNNNNNSSLQNHDHSRMRRSKSEFNSNFNQTRGSLMDFSGWGFRKLEIWFYNLVFIFHIIAKMILLYLLRDIYHTHLTRFPDKNFGLRSKTVFILIYLLTRATKSIRFINLRNNFTTSTYFYGVLLLNQHYRR